MTTRNLGWPIAGAQTTFSEVDEDLYVARIPSCLRLRASAFRLVARFTI
jgi:hypothetical protein